MNGTIQTGNHTTTDVTFSQILQKHCSRKLFFIGVILCFVGMMFQITSLPRWWGATIFPMTFVILSTLGLYAIFIESKRKRGHKITFGVLTFFWMWTIIFLVFYVISIPISINNTSYIQHDTMNLHDIFSFSFYFRNSIIKVIFLAAFIRVIGDMRKLLKENAQVDEQGKLRNVWLLSVFSIIAAYMEWMEIGILTSIMNFISFCHKVFGEGIFQLCGRPPTGAQLVIISASIFAIILYRLNHDLNKPNQI
ncbi:MAG: hypothetical protein FWC32_11265 [Firmicutes bacterium]|nr:hypothetical protein [Bacillota bacterium]